MVNCSLWHGMVQENYHLFSKLGNNSISSELWLRTSGQIYRNPMEENATLAWNCTEMDHNHPYGNTARNTQVPEPPLYLMICVTIIYIVIFLTGVIGNILVCFVIFKHPDMRTTTNFFLVNLSIADLLVLIICMPPSFVDLYAKEVWHFGHVMCK